MALTKRDWHGSNDNLITYDSVSNLEWLDITVTAGLSYNDVANQLAGQLAGWHYASFSQIQGFYKNFNLTNFYPVGEIAGFLNNSWNPLVSFIGDISTVNGDAREFYGLCDSSLWQNVGYVFHKLLSNGSGHVKFENDDKTKAEAAPNIGSFLVRTPLSAPTAPSSLNVK